MFAFITLYFFIFLLAMFQLAFEPANGSVLTLTMLLGRLEIFPVLILFNHRTWKRV